MSSRSTARGYTPLGKVESDRSGDLITARSQASGALVDIRVLAPELKDDAALMRRLRRDMGVLREVRHTNLVSVMDFDRRVGAVIYESVPGSTVTQLLRAQGSLGLAASMVLLEDCISGLEALHSAGVLHRNVTPDSLVVESTGAVLLRDAELETTSTAGLVAAQRPYLAPEVLAGSPFTRCADLYAATAVFLEVIGGRASKPGMRTDLRPLLEQGMALDPSARSATLDDFRRELDDYARATVGETWRKDGRALLIIAAATQVTKIVRVATSPERDGESADKARAAVALLKSRGRRDPRVSIGFGALGFAALVVLLFLAQALPGAPGAPARLIFAPFNGVPSTNSSSSPPPAAGAPGPSSGSTSNVGPGNPVAPIVANPSGTPNPTPPPNPALLSQTITWMTAPPSGATYSGSYTIGARGGGSRLPVVFSSQTPIVCIRGAGNTFTFNGVGQCTILATEEGNSQYNPAPARTMPFVVGKASQSISFTTTPSGPTYNGTYLVGATAAGGAVTFAADPASVACSVTPTGTVVFTAAGTCIIDADQIGNAYYSAATLPQVFRVRQASQQVTMTSSPPCSTCGSVVQYTVSGTATSGLTVTFGIDSSSTFGACSITGNVVSINGGTGFPGNCVIDFYQGGDTNFAAAPTQSQTIIVS